MTDEQRQEREDWEALVGSAGWQRLQVLAEQEWTGAVAFKRRVIQAMNRMDAAEAVRQVVAASGAVGLVLGQPSERLRGLSKPEGEPDRFKAQRRVP